MNLALFLYRCYNVFACFVKSDLFDLVFILGISFVSIIAIVEFIKYTVSLRR